MHPTRFESPSDRARSGLAPTPSSNGDLPFRRADFDSLSAALDYAAGGVTGLNFYGVRGELKCAWTYAQLRHLARRTAAGLLGLGLQRGARVAIVAETRPEFVAAFFACQYAGLVAVPLPEQAGLGTREAYVATLANIVRSAGACAIVGPADLRGTLETAVADRPDVRVADVASLSHAEPADADLRPLGPDEVSHVQYSSGSTRAPRGIRIDQRAMMANAAAVATQGLDMRPGERAASWLPFYHDMGLIGFLLIPLTCQVTIDYMTPDGFARRPLQWLKLISENRCNLAFSPTFGYELCTRRSASAGALELDLSCWRVAGIGGEPVRHQILDAFAASFTAYGFRPEALVPSYGLAEATLAVSFDRLDAAPRVDWINTDALVHKSTATPANGEPGASGFVSCGSPMPGHAVEIRDDRNQALPPRRIGRICVRGPSLMHGYDGASIEAEPALDEQGWLDTGDLGYLADGQLYVTGRQKDLIIVNGRNILPQDLEWYAEQSSERLRSRDTAAFGVTDSEGRETPVILVQARTQDPSQREALRKGVHAAIFRSASVDCRVVLVPLRSLPFTSSGKLSRARARKLYLEGAFEEEALPRAASAG